MVDCSSSKSYDNKSGSSGDGVKCQPSSSWQIDSDNSSATPTSQKGYGRNVRINTSSVAFGGSCNPSGGMWLGLAGDFIEVVIAEAESKVDSSSDVGVGGDREQSESSESEV
jgi:hypothetical protein